MTSQPSTAERITLTSYNRINGAYRIDSKTLPPFVNHKEFHGGAITKLEWEEFCHLVDVKLQPINRLRNVLKIILAAFLVILLAFIIFVLFGYDQDTRSYFAQNQWFWVFPILLIVLTIAGVATASYTCMVTKKAFLSIKSLCEEQSKVLGTTTRANGSILVSFHLCDERSQTSFDVQTHDMAYTGDDYYHHPLRTYHNVYVLAVVTMVDAENGFAPSFVLPVKFPTIEFNSSTDSEDDSTIGEDTLYTTWGDMTTNGSLVRSIKHKRRQEEALHVRTPKEAPTKKKKKTKKTTEGENSSELEQKKSSKKNGKKKAGSDPDSGSDRDNKPKHKKNSKQTSKGKKGKKKTPKSDKGLDTITEAS